MTNDKRDDFYDAIQADMALGLVLQMGRVSREELIRYAIEKGIEIHLVPFLERFGLLDDEWWECIRRMGIPVPGRLH